MNGIVNMDRLLTLKNPRLAVSMVGNAFEVAGQYTFYSVSQAYIDGQLLLNSQNFVPVTDTNVLAAFASLGPNLYYFTSNPNEVFGTYGIPG